MLKKLIKITAGGLLLILLAFGVYLGLYAVAPPDKGLNFLIPVVTKEKSALSSENILRKETVYLCGDTEITYQGMVPESMWGKKLSEIYSEYPAEQGWIIDTSTKPLIVLSRQSENFCPAHASFRHFGVVNNKLSVYAGPLGYNQKLLRVEESLSFEKLPLDIRDALQQATSFGEQSKQQQEQLRKLLEFKDEQAVNAALENIDENG